MTTRGTSYIAQNPSAPQTPAFVPPPRQPVFSHAFELDGFVDEESPPFVFTLTGGITRVVAAVRVPTTSGTITVALRKNGVQFGTITIPATEKIAELAIQEDFAFGDQFTVKLTATGVGASDLTVIADPR